MKTETATTAAKNGSPAKPDSNKKEQNGNAPASSQAGNEQSREKEQSGKMAKESPFEKLFHDMLKDMYWAEQHLVGSLQTMSDAATTTELKDAFDDHIDVTQKHVNRLERVFKLLGKEAEAKKCDAMAGLIKEGESIIADTKEGTMTRDAGLIIAAQKVEHYEIASYGSLVQVALTLGYDRVAGILEKTLMDEADADVQLTDIAETYINPMADEEGEGEENAQKEKKLTKAEA